MKKLTCLLLLLFTSVGFAQVQQEDSYDPEEPLERVQQEMTDGPDLAYPPAGETVTEVPASDEIYDDSQVDEEN